MCGMSRKLGQLKLPCVSLTLMVFLQVQRPHRLGPPGLYLSWSYYGAFTQGNVQLLAPFATGDVWSSCCAAPVAPGGGTLVLFLLLSF